MKKILFLSMILLALSSCKNNPNKSEQMTNSGNELESFIAKESLAAGGYVYILGELDEGELRWFALTAREVNVGDKFYYEDPLVMNDFYSKELERPFDEIVFLSRVSTNPEELNQPKSRIANKPSGKITTEQLELNIDRPEGVISLSQLFEQMQKYQGQRVKVRGQVMKFSPEIMNTNWIHIQDGTDYNGKYDLTITSTESVDVGDILTFEGLVSVDKDFGYGYFYELLIEEAIVVK